MKTQDIRNIALALKDIREGAKELNEKVKEHKGVAYFKTRKDAEAHMKKFAPKGRVVEYERGHAVQTRISGPYLNKAGIAEGAMKRGKDLDTYRKEPPKKEDNSNDVSDDGEGLDKVQPKAVKKKFKDRKDKDIDNDGDVDSSDKFLHKRRKAVSKAIASKKKPSVEKDADVEVQEGIIGNLAKAGAKAAGRAIKKQGQKVVKKVADKTGITTAKKLVKKVGSGIATVKKAALTGEEVKEDITHQTVKPPSHTKKYSNPKTMAALGAEKKLTSDQLAAHGKAAKHHSDIADGHTQAMEKSKSSDIKQMHAHAARAHKKAADGHNSIASSRQGRTSGAALSLAVSSTRNANDHSQAVRTDFTKKKRVNEASAATATHTPNNGADAEDGLTPNGKKMMAMKTDGPEGTDITKVAPKTFAAMRASGKKAAMRNNDNAQGDKTPPKNDGK